MLPPGGGVPTLRAKCTQCLWPQCAGIFPPWLSGWCNLGHSLMSPGSAPSLSIVECGLYCLHGGLWLVVKQWKQLIKSIKVKSKQMNLFSPEEIKICFVW